MSGREVLGDITDRSNGIAVRPRVVNYNQVAASLYLETMDSFLLVERIEYMADGPRRIQVLLDRHLDEFLETKNLIEERILYIERTLSLFERENRNPQFVYNWRVRGVVRVIKDRLEESLRKREGRRRQ